MNVQIHMNVFVVSKCRWCEVRAIPGRLDALTVTCGRMCTVHCALCRPPRHTSRHLCQPPAV